MAELYHNQQERKKILIDYKKNCRGTRLEDEYKILNNKGFINPLAKKNRSKLPRESVKNEDNNKLQQITNLLRRH